MVLYAFGSNSAGQLGIGNREDTSSPLPCVFDKALIKKSAIPVRIVAGGNHTLVLLSNGGLKGAGATRYTPNSKNSSECFSSFEDFQLDEIVKLCSATWEALVAITSTGSVYTEGTGDKGELGRGFHVTTTEMSPAPLDILGLWPNGTSIIDVASGVHHTIIVLSNGDVFGWGNGRKGQLGEPSEIVWKPRKIEGLSFKVVRAVCGREFTYLVGEPQGGHHVILGANKWGLKSNCPQNIIGWRDIGASWASIFVLNRQGQIVSWGRNDHGQLALENLPMIKKMAVGSEHVLALTECGKVLAWGWGEHGNCGEIIDADGDVKHRWNEISLPPYTTSTKVVGIGAGWATSWIWS